MNVYKGDMYRRIAIQGTATSGQREVAREREQERYRHALRMVRCF